MRLIRLSVYIDMQSKAVTKNGVALISIEVTLFFFLSPTDVAQYHGSCVGALSTILTLRSFFSNLVYEAVLKNSFLYPPVTRQEQRESANCIGARAGQTLGDLHCSRQNAAQRIPIHSVVKKVLESSMDTSVFVSPPNKAVEG